MSPEDPRASHEHDTLIDDLETLRLRVMHMSHYPPEMTPEGVDEVVDPYYSAADSLLVAAVNIARLRREHNQLAPEMVEQRFTDIIASLDDEGRANIELAAMGHTAVTVTDDVLYHSLDGELLQDDS